MLSLICAMALATTEDPLDVTLLAAGSDREVTLSEAPNDLALILFSSVSADAAVELNRSLRDVWPTIEELTVWNVADLSGIGILLRGEAVRRLNEEYREYISELPPDYDPAEYLVLLKDWRGTVRMRLGIEEVRSQIAVAFVQEGEIRQVWRGDDPVELLREFSAAKNSQPPSSTHFFH